MLKKSLSLLLTLVMCLALVPMTTLAADLSGYYWAETFEVTGFWGTVILSEVENTASNSTVTGTFANGAGTITGVATGNGFGGKWSNSANGTSGQVTMRRNYGKDSTGLEVEWKYDTGADTSWHKETGVLISSAPWEKASEWATDTLQKANDMGLIPDSLKGADLTKPITRKEFAAVAVKTYENLTGKKTTPVAKNPFTDTNDTEVLKAYNVGITSGTAADKFSPDVLLNREQAATMLTRVLKAAYIPGWTGATDSNYTLGFTQPSKFSDDDKISDWAKPSVYFMAANGVISGTGNNMFSPRAVTTAEQAANYASATREQALVIAVRMVDNLKGKPLDYKESAAATPTTPTLTGLTLADFKANAQAAVHGIEVGYAAHTGDDFPKAKDGFYVIYKNNHDYDNIMVFELSSAADAKKYADAVQNAIESAKVRYYDRFVVEIAIVDKAVRPTFTDDMANAVMKDLFKAEGTAAQGAAAVPTKSEPSGNAIDSAIIGRWWRLTSRKNGKDEMTFGENGVFTFKCSYTSTTSLVNMNIIDLTIGNYRIDKNGKVTLYNLVNNPELSYRADVPDMTLSYSFTQTGGETFIVITDFSHISGAVYEDNTLEFHKG